MPKNFLWNILAENKILSMRFRNTTNIELYPPKGLCIADTEGGPIVFTYVLFCVRKRILDFQFIGGFLHF